MYRKKAHTHGCSCKNNCFLADDAQDDDATRRMIDINMMVGNSWPLYRLPLFSNCYVYVKEMIHVFFNTNIKEKPAINTIQSSTCSVHHQHPSNPTNLTNRPWAAAASSPERGKASCDPMAIEERTWKLSGARQELISKERPGSLVATGLLSVHALARRVGSQ